LKENLALAIKKVVLGSIIPKMENKMIYISSYVKLQGDSDCEPKKLIAVQISLQKAKCKLNTSGKKSCIIILCKILAFISG